MNGLFLTLEGGDGAGKTTQADLLQSWLEDRGHEVVRTREPGGTRLGKALRDLLLHGESVSPRAEALLYAADRAQHVTEVVRPALGRGAVVVQDRYIDSSVAYQGGGRVLNSDDIRRISDWASEGLAPALTILLDVPPATAAERMSDAGRAADRLESEAEDFHQSVRDEFLRIADAEPARFLVLDGTDEIDEVHGAIIARVASMLVGL